MRTSHHIIADINRFQREDDNWLGLEALLAELWKTGDAESFTVDLLKDNCRASISCESGGKFIIVSGVPVS